jgi:hypothetical protein
MSDEWIFYPCQMGEQRASIFYDHGIRETVDQIAPSQLLKVRVTFKHPRPDGLSSNEEYQQLCALEDELQSVVGQNGDLYVGRITVGGHRYLHIFTSDFESDWSSRLRAIGEHHGYELSFVMKTDATRDGYWKDLFPSEDDWQVIKDLRVLEVLGSRGDDGTTSRRVDHWAYFPTRHLAEKFSQWAQARNYSLDTTAIADDGKFCVHFAHDGTLRLPDITSHTIALRRKATELGGDYDGWETPVCKASG